MKRPLIPNTRPTGCWKSRGFQMRTWSPWWKEPLGNNDGEVAEETRAGSWRGGSSGEGVETRTERREVHGWGEGWDGRERLDSKWVMWSISAWARWTLEMAAVRDWVAVESADVSSVCVEVRTERAGSVTWKSVDADEIEEEEERRRELSCMSRQEKEENYRIQMSPKPRCDRKCFITFRADWNRNFWDKSSFHDLTNLTSYLKRRWSTCVTDFVLIFKSHLWLSNYLYCSFV